MQLVFLRINLKEVIEMFNGDILGKDITSQIMQTLTDMTEKVERRVLSGTATKNDNQIPEGYKKLEKVIYILRAY